MTHINQRHDTAANWASTNPVLQLGEVGWEIDDLATGVLKAKMGDGVEAWNDRPYAINTDGPVTSVAGKTGDVSLDKNDVGLGNVNNTADGEKPISTDQQAAFDALADAVAEKADLASPEFTGNPKVPTPGVSDNDTSIANTKFVKDVLDSLGDVGDKRLVVGPIMVQWGDVVVSMSGAAFQSEAVAFDTPFDAPPNVFLTTSTADTTKVYAVLDFTAGVPTASLFNIGVKTTDGTTSGASPTIHWLAIGPA